MTFLTSLWTTKGRVHSRTIMRPPTMLTWPVSLSCISWSIKKWSMLVFSLARVKRVAEEIMPIMEMVPSSSLPNKHQEQLAKRKPKLEPTPRISNISLSSLMAHIPRSSSIRWWWMQEALADSSTWNRASTSLACRKVLSWPSSLPRFTCNSKMASSTLWRLFRSLSYSMPMETFLSSKIALRRSTLSSSLLTKLWSRARGLKTWFLSCCNDKTCKSLKWPSISRRPSSRLTQTLTRNEAQRIVIEFCSKQSLGIQCAQINQMIRMDALSSKKPDWQQDGRPWFQLNANACVLGEHVRTPNE